MLFCGFCLRVVFESSLVFWSISEAKSRRINSRFAPCNCKCFRKLQNHGFYGIRSDFLFSLFQFQQLYVFFYCQKFRTVPFLPFASLKNLFSVIRIPLKSASDSQNSPSDVSNTNYPCPFFTRNWPEKVWKTKIIGLTSLLKFYMYKFSS